MTLIATGTLKTKALSEPAAPEDGFRLLIVRWKNPGVPRSAYDWWDARLAPTASLLSEAFSRDVSLDDTWGWYVQRFLDEMRGRSPRIAMDEVQQLLATGRNVTLLCFCKNEARCHRRLVREAIDIESHLRPWEA